MGNLMYGYYGYYGLSSHVYIISLITWWVTFPDLKGPFGWHSKAIVEAVKKERANQAGTVSQFPGKKACRMFTGDSKVS